MTSVSTRRMYRRVLSECQACILTSQALRRCTIRDLSLSGFRIQGQTKLAVETVVMLRVWLPGVPLPVDIDQAVVRWERGVECGVEIVSISSGADFQLAQFVGRAVQCSFGLGGPAGTTDLHNLSGDDVGIQARVRGLRQRVEA